MDFRYDKSSLYEMEVNQYTDAFMNKSVRDNLSDFLTVAGALITIKRMFASNQELVASIDYVLEIMKSNRND